MIEKIKNFALAMIVVMQCLSSSPLLAHGWVVSPPSRQELCQQDRAGFDCGAIKWEPQSVEGYKGSTLCSGGSPFTVLDRGGPWPTTTVGSTVVFRWQLTAAHRTSNWEYYVDGGLKERFDQGQQIPPGTIEHVIHDLPRGYHKVLAVWNIADTPMAFYNCVDLMIE